MTLSQAFWSKALSRASSLLAAVYRCNACEIIPELLGTDFAAAYAHDGEIGRQSLPPRQIVERRHQEPVAQVARDSKNDERA